MDSSVDRFLVELLQSAYGNLPQLVSKISAKRNVSNDEALRYVLSEFQKITSLETVSRSVNDWERNSQIEDLRAELRYLKSYYTKNNAVADKIRAYSDELARTKRQLAEAEKARERSRQDREPVGLLEELQDKEHGYKIERARLMRRIEELTNELTSEREKHERRFDSLNDSRYRDEETIDRLNQELDRYRDENVKMMEQLRTIGRMLNPDEQDMNRVTEMFSEFLYRYNEQKELEKSMRSLRDSIKLKIANFVSEITMIPDESCSNHDFMKRVMDLLFEESQRLRNTMTTTTDPETRDVLAESDRVVKSLTDALNDSGDRITELERTRRELTSQLNDAIQDKNKLLAHVTQLERSIVEIEASMDPRNFDTNPEKLRASANADTQTENNESTEETIRYNEASARLEQSLDAMKRLREDIRDRDAKILELETLLQKHHAAWKLDSERVMRMMDQSVQTAATADPNKSPIISAELSLALTELKRHLLGGNECINTDAEFLEFVSQVTKAKSPQMLERALSELSTNNKELESKVAELKRLLRESQRLDDSLNRLDALNEQTGHDKDVLDMIVNGNGNDDDDGDAIYEKRSWWKHKVVKPRGRKRKASREKEKAKNIKRRIVQYIESNDELNFARHHEAISPVHRLDDGDGDSGHSSHDLEIVRVLSPDLVDVPSCRVPADPSFSMDAEPNTPVMGSEDLLELTTADECIDDALNLVGIPASLPPSALSDDEIKNNL